MGDPLLTAVKDRPREPTQRHIAPHREARETPGLQTLELGQHHCAWGSSGWHQVRLPVSRHSEPAQTMSGHFSSEWNVRTGFSSVSSCRSTFVLSRLTSIDDSGQRPRASRIRRSTVSLFLNRLAFHMLEPAELVTVQLPSFCQDSDDAPLGAYGHDVAANVLHFPGAFDADV